MAPPLRRTGKDTHKVSQLNEFTERAAPKLEERHTKGYRSEKQNIRVLLGCWLYLMRPRGDGRIPLGHRAEPCARDYAIREIILEWWTDCSKPPRMIQTFANDLYAGWCEASFLRLGHGSSEVSRRVSGVGYNHRSTRKIPWDRDRFSLLRKKKMYDAHLRIGSAVSL